MVRTMNLRQIETFVRVAELGSFSQAALVLGIAQPALSRQVRLLETDMGVTLLTRTGRGVVLTEAGERLREHATAILQLVQRTRDDVNASREEPTGRVTLALPPSLGRRLVLPLVERFEQQLPKARLAIVEGLSAHIIEWISTGRADLGLVYNPPALAAMETLAVAEEALCLVSPASPGKRATRAAVPLSVALADLGAYPLVVPEPAHAIRQLLQGQAARAGVKLTVAWEVSSVPSILELVRAGHGHAVLGAEAVRALGSEAARGFVVRPITEPVLVTTLCLAWPARRPMTPLVQRTMGLLQTLLPGQASHAKKP